ncbi:hypothetical protein ACP5PY_18125 [Photobacterium leiognathi subsp. mandapamensis]
MQTQHEKQHNDFVTSYNGLVQMFQTTSKRTTNSVSKSANAAGKSRELAARISSSWKSNTYGKKYNKTKR